MGMFGEGGGGLEGPAPKAQPLSPAPPQVSQPQPPAYAGPQYGGGGLMGTGQQSGTTGLQSASGGNFLQGLGNHFGFGAPTTAGMNQAPQMNRDDFLLGGSAGAAQGLLGASQARADMYGGRAGPEFDLSNAQNGLGGAFGLRGAEAAQTQMLMRQARGEGPSLAASQFQQNMAQNTAQAQGLATSARGGAGVLGARQASEVGFNGGQQAAVGAADIRTREMQAAQGQLAAQLAQRNQAELARGGLGLGMSQASAGLQMQQRGLNDAAQQAELQRYQQMLQMNQQGLMGYQTGQSANQLQNQQANNQLTLANMQQQNAQDAKKGALFNTVANVATGGGFSAVKGIFGF